MITPQIKAIDTSYGGCLFRSRLEARWAVFFDNLSWKWLYEHEGYELENGRYLPDFFFPEINAFAEVKPYGLDAKERQKCIDLSMAFEDVPVLLCIGNPGYSHIPSIRNGSNCLDIVPVPFGHKYYPFFYESVSTDKKGIQHFKQYHDFTANAVLIANESRFEFLTPNDYR